MAETKRYDVGGKDRGGGRVYPEGTILKLTDTQAAAMGLSSSDVSSMTTTADDSAKRDRYEQAMTSQEQMRDSEAKAAEAENKKRTAKDK